MNAGSSPSSSPERSKKVEDVMEDKDRMSKLPNNLLENNLLRLSTDEAIRTSVLSTQWVDLRKLRPDIALNMRELPKPTPDSVHLADTMIKTMEKHCGHLESAIIHHYISQTQDVTLQSLIHTMTRVKHTKALTLVSHVGRTPNDLFVEELPEVVYHHSLTSLSLSGYNLGSEGAFTNCWNLKTLKLSNILIWKASVLSTVFELCPSLEVIVLGVHSIFFSGVLKIKNKNLKFLQVTSSGKIERIEVYATSLDVLDIRFTECERENFILHAPSVWFRRNYWVVGNFREPRPHLSYDITDLAQEKKGIWHELMMSAGKRSPHCVLSVDDDVFCDKRPRRGSLSVSVDLTNPKEVEILKEVLLMWSTKAMKELEIFFKFNTNAPREEGEAHKLLSEDEKPFPNADFRVETVWMYNFSGTSEEEFALASHFVTQKTVTKKMMIMTSSLSPVEKLEVKSAVDKLKELQGDQHLRIRCF